MQGGDVVGSRVLGGAGGGRGRERDADELLSVVGRWSAVRRGDRVGVEENEVVWRRRRGVGVLNIGRVHKYEGLKTVRCLDFRVPMKVRRHRMMFICFHESTLQKSMLFSVLSLHLLLVLLIFLHSQSRVFEIEINPFERLGFDEELWYGREKWKEGNFVCFGLDVRVL